MQTVFQLRLCPLPACLSNQVITPTNVVNANSTYNRSYFFQGALSLSHSYDDVLSFRRRGYLIIKKTHPVSCRFVAGVSTQLFVATHELYLCTLQVHGSGKQCSGSGDDTEHPVCAAGLLPP